MSRGIFRQLVLRAIRTEYLNNISGFAWLFLQPLMLLAVYAFVFTTVFKARIPGLSADAFVPFLAVAFWPWTAFSESVLRASNVVTANAALIGKVAFSTELLPLSTVTATFLMHMSGYLAVLLVLQLAGTDIHWLGLLPALAVLFVLYVFAVALALFFSALHVFVRDLGQILPPLMTFWFFMSPILYSPELLPAHLAELMRWNPMTWIVGCLRDLLMFDGHRWGWSDAVVPVVALILAWAGLRFFRRMSGHFEDFA
ncbi:MAG: ABC transporter permease [Xanthomonadales bacterium]|nr:ABC transporter permease [Xanthomonadales bacterium]